MRRRHNSDPRQTDGLVGCVVALATIGTAIGIWTYIPLLVVVSPVAALVALGWGIYRHVRAAAGREEGPGSKG